MTNYEWCGNGTRGPILTLGRSKGDEVTERPPLEKKVIKVSPPSKHDTPMNVGGPFYPESTYHPCPRLALHSPMTLEQSTHNTMPSTHLLGALPTMGRPLNEKKTTPHPKPIIYSPTNSIVLIGIIYLFIYGFNPTRVRVGFMSVKFRLVAIN